MRTQTEINRQIEGLEKERKQVPHRSIFGDDNWGAIDAQLSILREESTYNNYENEEYNVESAAYDAQEWLNENIDDDLFSE